MVSGNLASRAAATASVSELSLTSRLDLATTEKLRKYRARCRTQGWSFSTFVADTYGALRSDARIFIGEKELRVCTNRVLYN